MDSIGILLVLVVAGTLFIVFTVTLIVDLVRGAPLLATLRRWASQVIDLVLGLG